MLDVETLGVALKLVKEGGGGGGEGAAIIDDSKILTSTTWSSQKIVDTLCPPFTVSGATVQCTPVANYPLGVTASWEPRQEGTGDPSPENVRPIAGIDAVTVTLSGSAGTGTTATLTLPETIYGGTVDAASGAGNKNAKIVVVDGNEIKFSPGVNPDYWNLPNNSSPGIAFESTNISNYLPPGTLKNNAENKFIYTTATLMGSVFPTVENLNEFCAEQAEKGTPVQICYQLATPEPFQATGGQPLPALPGTNTIYTDAGNITVTGASDPIATITALQDRVSALESAALN